MTSPLLEFQSVSKRFGGTQAVDGVSFDVKAGEIVALLGENGAGKSTLIKLLAGIFPIDSGEIRFEGRPQAQWRSSDRSRQPVAFIHQDLGLVEWMTVAENVALGMGYKRRFGLIDWRAARSAAQRVMARVGCDIDPERRRAWDSAHGNRRTVDQHLAGVGLLDAADDPHQRGLAGAVLAHQRVHFAGEQFELDLVQRPYTGERLGKIPDRDNW